MALITEGWYRHYVLAIMTLVYTMSLLDQNLMLLLLQPIGTDLHLSDTELGIASGAAYGAIYAVMGLPIARLSDRADRSTIAAIALAIWGVTVSACIFVARFPPFLMARFAAAVGAAGCMPPTYSLSGAYFAGQAERTKAITIYMLAGSIASLVSFIGGGWLNGIVGWRLTFLLMGVPGIAIAALVKLTIKDPRTDGAAGTHTGEPNSWQVVQALWQGAASRNLVLAIMFLFMLMCGLGPWYAAFMIRSHNMDTSSLGLWLGLIFGGCGIAGTSVGGYVASRWLSGSVAWQMRIIAIVVLSLIPLFGLVLFSRDGDGALMAFIPYILALNVFLGPTFALLQSIVPDDMRATSLALVMLAANLVGMSIGPQAVGALSDALRPLLGANSLRYALMSFSSMAAISAFFFWKVGTTIDGTLQSVGTSDGAWGGPTTGKSCASLKAAFERRDCCDS